MVVIPIPTDNIVNFKKNEKGELISINMTVPWGNYFDQNTQQMQQSLSNEGFWIPSVSSANDSVTPAATGGKLAQVAASYYLPNTTPPQINPNGVQLGTLVYDPNTDQLKIFLNNSGTPAFVAITTS